MAEETPERYIIDFKDCPSTRQKMNELDVEKRKANFEEVETGFPSELAQEEAKRCLSCRRCLGCGLCLAVCEPKAILFDQEDEVLDLIVDDIIISPEAGPYIPLARGELGYGECTNVVTSFQFDRILDEDGPYGGLIMRPYDGEIPQNIAFVIHNDFADHEDKDDSASLVAYALQQTGQAIQKVPGLDISVFVPEEIDLAKLPRETKKKGVNIITGKPAAAREAENTRNVVITLEPGDKGKEEEFEMLVIAKEPEVSPDISNLRKEFY